LVPNNHEFQGSCYIAFLICTIVSISGVAALGAVVSRKFTSSLQNTQRYTDSSVFIIRFLASFHKQCVFPGVEEIGYINVSACTGITELRNLGKILYKVVCK
jgi:hypothetical protein